MRNMEEVTGDILPDGRAFFRCQDGSFLPHPETGLPDKSRPLDAPPEPTLDDVLRAWQQ